MDETQKLIERLRFEWETNEEYITKFTRAEQSLILKALEAAAVEWRLAADTRAK